MVIDPTQEALRPLRDAPDLFVALGLPRPQYECVRRWQRSGVDGVILGSVKYGGRYFVSAESVERFAAACNAEAPR